MELAYRKLFGLFLILGAFVSTECFGQDQVFKVVGDSASVIVTGESTLHDWTVTTSNVSDYPDEFQLKIADGEALKEFSFKVEVASMDGGRGASMNGKIYTALKSDSFPFITFVQNKPGVLKMSGDNGFSLVSEGVLTIAGKSLDALVNVDGKIENGLLRLATSHNIKMTDFDIDPPSAMFGQIQTKDDITINIKFIYQLD